MSSSRSAHHQSSSCRAKRQLLRGVRPNANSQHSHIDPCSASCIYCDIWQLATFVFSRVPTSPVQSPVSSPASSPRSVSSFHSMSPRSDSDPEQLYKSIDAAYQTQRSRLNSILSICTVEGAAESEGLRMAHDRCLIQVTALVNQERMLEERAEQQRLQEEYEEQYEQYHYEQLQYTQRQYSASMTMNREYERRPTSHMVR